MVTGRRILLLADDSPATQKVVSLTFADEGLEVVAVGDGTEAARRLEEGLTPDIVLADVIMPGLTGYELCERIKGDGRLARVPVVLLVGTFEPFNEAEARRVGADTVLTKPFQSIRDLVSKVGSLLGGAKPEAEDETTRPAAPPQEASQMETAPPPEASRQEPPSRLDAASSFADLVSDDELIEARPAENYAETQTGPRAAVAAQAEAEGAHAEADAAQAPVAAGAAHDSFADTLRDPFAAVAPRAADEWRGEAERRDEAQVFAETQTSFARVPVAEEARAPQPAFAARAAGAAAADDALLDLDLDAPASVSEVDDFILDLGLDDEPPAPREAAPAQAAPDAAGAFAEAAHGETVQDSRAAVQQLQDIQVEHEHMATEVVAQEE
ncbi:MAG TPA: response regulator, partial [Pyrinomonadaceae bacterium]|nr:response regulator [Pyrinomonadaceae bacterium]